MNWAILLLFAIILSACNADDVFDYATFAMHNSANW